MAEEIRSEIVEVILAIEREVAQQYEHDKHRGFHAGEGPKLNRELQIYKAGVRNEIPKEWASILKKLDPDYQKYLELKKKFEGE